MSPSGIIGRMCRSIADGGRRCRCVTPEAAEKKRAARNRAQKRYLARKRAERVEAETTVSEPGTAPVLPEPENPFADFVPESVNLTAEQRDAEQAKLDDFFVRKQRDPNAVWDAAPKPTEVEANFFAFLAELRGVTST